MKTKLLSLIFLLPLFLTLTGCIGVNNEFKDIRDTVFSSMDISPKKDLEIGLGSAGLTLAGGFIRFAEENDLPADIISYLDGAQVGVYKQRGRIDISPEAFREFSDIMKKNGWQYIVRVLDDYQASIVFVSDNIEDGINQMLIINSQDHELYIAELSGDLEMIAAALIRNKNFDLGLAHN